MSLNRRALLGSALALPVLAAQPAFAQEIGSKNRPLRIGTAAGPHTQLLEKVQEIAARDGLFLQIIPFTDYITPNLALAAKELDANSYQHLPFLEQMVRDRNLPLVAVGKTLVFPIGVYSRKHKKLDELPNGARVAIPNDPTNGGRALALLAANGVFKLTPGADFRASIADITENPKNIRILELEAAQIPRVLDEVDAAVINTDYSIPAGLNPVRDAIAIENADSPYANLIVVHRDDKDAPWVKRLVAAYQNDEIRKFVQEIFQGSAVPAF